MTGSGPVLEVTDGGGAPAVPGGIFNNYINATASVNNSPVTQSAPITQIITGGTVPQATVPPIQVPPINTGGGGQTTIPPNTGGGTNTVPVIGNNPGGGGTTPVVNIPQVPVIIPGNTSGSGSGGGSTTTPQTPPPQVPVIIPGNTSGGGNTGGGGGTTTPPQQPPQLPPQTPPPTTQPQPPAFTNVQGIISKNGTVTARPPLPASVANPGAINWTAAKMVDIKMADGSTKTELVYSDASGQIQGQWRASEVQALGGKVADVKPNWFISTDGKYRDGTKTISGAYTYQEMLQIMQNPGMKGAIIAPQQRPLTVAEQADQRVAAEAAKNQEAYNQMLASLAPKPATTPQTGAPIGASPGGMGAYRMAPIQPYYVSPGGSAPSADIASGRAITPAQQPQYAQAVTGTSSSGRAPTADQVWTQDFYGTPAFQRTNYQPNIPTDVSGALQRFQFANDPANAGYSQGGTGWQSTQAQDWMTLLNYVNTQDKANEPALRQWMQQRDAAIAKYGGAEYMAGQMSGSAVPYGLSAMQNFTTDRTTGQILLPEGSQLGNMLLAYESLGVPVPPSLMAYANQRDYMMWNMSLDPAGGTGGEYWTVPWQGGPSQAAQDWGSAGISYSYYDPTDGDTTGVLWNGYGPPTLDPNTGLPTGSTANQPTGGMSGGSSTKNYAPSDSSTVSGQVLPKPGMSSDGKTMIPVNDPYLQTQTPTIDQSYNGVPPGGSQDVGGSWTITPDGQPVFIPGAPAPTPGYDRYYDPSNPLNLPPGYQPEGGPGQFGVPGSTVFPNGSYYGTTTSAPAVVPQGGMAPVPPISSGDVFTQGAPAMTSSSTNYNDPITPYGGGSMADGIIAGQVNAGGATTAAQSLKAATPKTTTKTFAQKAAARRKK